MLHRLHVPIAASLILNVVSCTGEPPDPDLAALRQALEEEYPGAGFDVGFEDGRDHLELTVDTAVYGNYRLDDSQRRALGEEMARFALGRYGAASDLDSITVEFVQERSSGWFSKSWAMSVERFGVNDLRQSVNP